MERFEGRTAVITGAAGGIGLATAQRLAREGMKVVLSDVRREGLDAAVDTIRAAGGQAIGVVSDVSSWDSVGALAARTRETYGATHLLFANAGVVTYGSLWDQSLDEWSWMLDVNLWGVVHCLRAFVPGMLESGEEGHVAMTSSSSGMSAASSSAYTAAKYAVVGIADGLAKDLAGTRLGVSVLCPGGVATRIMESEEIRPQGTEHGLITPAVAQRMAALASPDRTDRAAPEAIADILIQAIRENRLYVLPMQGRLKDDIAARLERIRDGLAWSPTTAP